MEAAEAKVQKVLEGSKQFLVPHYQRPYSWHEPQWKVLWRDIIELAEDDDPKPHFLGPIVTSPARSVPEGVEKRLLIDGQQRLTTLVLLMTLIRDLARERGVAKIAERIDDLVTNRHEDGHDRHKLLPTQGEVPAESDRENLVRLLEGTSAPTGGGIAAAAAFFSAKLRRADAPPLDKLLRMITTKLTLVSIILDEKDNPHRIFESLNGKGRPLSQADLIRNFFFMRVPEKDSELGNLSFAEKKKMFAESNVALNRYFADVEQWSGREIERRAEILVDLALQIWPHFGPREVAIETNPADPQVKGTVPRLARVRGQERVVDSWVDVAVETIEAIIGIGAEEFETLVAEMPKFVNTDATAFRRSSRLKKLSNGAYLETNISATAIHRLCVQAVQLAGLRPDEWEVVREEDDGSGDVSAPSRVGQLQLEFWNATKEALLATGTWTSLRASSPQSSYVLPLGRTGAHLEAHVNTGEKLVGVRLVLRPEVAEALLAALEAQKADIERELGLRLMWNPNPESKTKRIRVTHSANVLDEASWPAAIEWLATTAVAFHRVFAPRVAKLDEPSA